MVTTHGGYGLRASERRTDRELLKRIRQIHADSDGVYGAAKITAELNEKGYPCGRHKVARLMRLAGLKGCPKTSFKVTTQRDPTHPVADNLLQQNFTAKEIEPALGVRYHLHQDTPGVVVSGGGDGSLLASYRWLVDESLDQSAPGDQCTEHGA